MSKQTAHSLFPQVRQTMLAAAIMAAWAGSAGAQESTGGGAFQLGTVTVSATRVQLGEIGEDQVGSVITRKEMQKFNRNDVGDALNLLVPSRTII